MARNHDESKIGPHPVTRVSVNSEVPMSSFREWLEGLHPRNRNGSCS